MWNFPWRMTTYQQAAPLFLRSWFGGVWLQYLLPGSLSVVTTMAGYFIHALNASRHQGMDGCAVLLLLTALLTLISVSLPRNTAVYKPQTWGAWLPGWSRLVRRLVGWTQSSLACLEEDSKCNDGSPDGGETSLDAVRDGIQLRKIEQVCLSRMLATYIFVGYC